GVDTSLPRARVRRRGADRGAAAGGGRVDVQGGVGDGVLAALADRGDLEGAPPVSVPPAPPLLLASTSPQRRAILQQLGVPFEVEAPRFVEDDEAGVPPVELVRV